MYEYLLAGACVLGGLAVLFRMLKEHKIFLPGGIFLILMGGWIFANKMLGGLLSSGWYVWLGRAAMLGMILLLLKALRDESKKKSAAGAEKDNTEQK